jgi:DNA-binding response OmpR family regulator
MEIALAKILIVDDDIHIANLIARFLQQKQYQVECTHDGQNAIDIFQKFRPDLVILDINLPDTLGYNLCQQMQENQDVFILMLTSRTDVEDKKRGFSTGADDYLTKPFDLEELEFRVQAILRRRRVVDSSQMNLIEIGDLSINPESREVKVKDKSINLTSLEFDLLYFLASNPVKVWRREDLVTHVWQNNPMGDNRVVDVHIGQIRRKIEADSSNPLYIFTIRGVGYKFDYQPN